MSATTERERRPARDMETESLLPPEVPAVDLEESRRGASIEEIVASMRPEPSWRGRLRAWVVRLLGQRRR